MTQPDMTILDYEMMGRLIEKWAKGEVARPTTIGEFRRIAADHGVRIELVGYADSDPVEVVPPPTTGTLRIALPDPGRIGGAPPADYPLPEFYALDAFDGAEPAVADGIRFRYKRIGEYTTQKCL
jgi:hypothetical protein